MHYLDHAATTPIPEAVAEEMCRVLREDAGLHFLLELDTSRSDGELEALAGEQGIRLSFLSHYARVPGTAAAHMLVVNYPGVDLERLDQALEILSGILS